MSALLVLLALLAGAPDDGVDAVAVRRLVRDLGAESWPDRERAYRSLRTLGEAAAPFLEEALLEGDDLDVRRAAARLLGELDSSGRRQLLRGLRDRAADFRKTATYTTLMGQKREALPLLLVAIQREYGTYPQYDFYTLRNAYALLQDLASAGVLTHEDTDVMIGLLETPNTQARRLGTPLLKALLGDDLPNVLEATFRNSASPDARAHVLEMLESQASDRTHALIPEAADDEQAAVRLAAVRIMGRRPKDEHLPLLLKAAADPAPEVRAAVLNALPRHSDHREARIAIHTSLQDPDESVRRAAIQAASQLSGRKIAPSLVPFVRPFVRDRDPAVVQAAAQLLGRLRDRDATPLLLAALTRGDETFRQQIAISVLDAIGRIGDPTAREPLERLLDDEALSDDRGFRTTRVYATQALVRIAGREALPRLAAVLEEDEDYAPQILVQVLLEIAAPERIPLLRRALDHENDFVVARAAQGLGQAGSRQDAARLVALLSRDNAYLRQSVLEALVALGSEEAAPPVLALLEAMVTADGDGTNRHHAQLAVQALAAARHRPAAPTLVTLVQRRGRLGLDAAEALGRTGGEGAREAVAAIVETYALGSTQSRRAAAALALLGDDGPLRKIHEQDREAVIDENPDPGALSRAADSGIRLGMRDAALAWARRRVELLPEDPFARYDLACVLALADRDEEALEALEKARALGYRNPGQLIRDPDLDGVRDRQEFREILARMNR